MSETEICHKVGGARLKALKGYENCDEVAKLTYIVSTGSIYVELNDRFKTTVIFPHNVSLHKLCVYMRTLVGSVPYTEVMSKLTQTTTQKKLF